MGFIVEGTELISGEARRESFWITRGLGDSLEFSYEEMDHIGKVIEQIRATSYYEDWARKEGVL